MKYFHLLAVLGLVAGHYANPPEARAWGQLGHLTVCDLAYRNFTDTTRAQLKILFAIDGDSATAKQRVYSSFNYACLEEDARPRKHPSDHFINLPRDQLAITGPACPSHKSCILAGIDRDLGVLHDQSKPPTERARALMSVGHWVGDIHQPLHISFADDAGGNAIQATGACHKTNFHAVWDKCILEERILKKIPVHPGWKNSTYTYRTVDRLQKLTTPAEKATWSKGKPWQWAEESYAITLQPEVDYCTLKDGACWYSATQRTYNKNDPERVVEITPEYLDRYEPVVETRLRQAGYRLAYLVNQALDPDYHGVN